MFLPPVSQEVWVEAEQHGQVTVYMGQPDRLPRGLQHAAHLTHPQHEANMEKGVKISTQEQWGPRKAPRYSKKIEFFFKEEGVQLIRSPRKREGGGGLVPGGVQLLAQC